MKAKIAPFILFISLLCGCATSQPTFQATWFLLEKPANVCPNTPPTDNCPDRVVYLALLNRSNHTYKIKNIVVNQEKTEPGPFGGFFCNKPNTDYCGLVPNNNEEIVFYPGQFWLKPMSYFKRKPLPNSILNSGNTKHQSQSDNCSRDSKNIDIPVSVTLVYNEGNNSDDKTLEAEMNGSMPSAIPDEWIKKCCAPVSN